MVEVMKIIETSFRRSHACIDAMSVPDPAAGHRLSMPLPETPGYPQAGLVQSLLGLLFFSPGSWCTAAFVFAVQVSVSPVLCKFWWLCGGVHSDLLQEG